MVSYIASGGMTDRMRRFRRSAASGASAIQSPTDGAQLASLSRVVGGNRVDADTGDAEDSAATRPVRSTPPAQWTSTGPFVRSATAETARPKRSAKRSRKKR